jgi:Zn-dependent protease with chaperone function
MSTPDLMYPATPANLPASITAPSAAFKKEVSNVMGSLVLFFIVYILLILLSVLLTIGCVYGGIAIIVAVPRFITIMLGIGLISLGVMVLIFLVKFIFTETKYDRSGIIEITESEQPRLFAFIRQLTIDTQTQFPKRIYLSPEVNACVFYDSSFFSMFLPVKKNLQIGLGLVNAVNVSEFKAILAHEFGHFSQRSMKLGSFVYNVNRVIYNMLYENTGYSRSLQGWGEVSGYFAIFAAITAGIVRGIQWVLQQMYGLVNKSYMSLSREMEFHADAVAASVSGSGNCISALRRIELAGTSYNAVIQKCSDLFKSKLISANVYPNQQTITRQLAKDYKLALQNNLPVVNDTFLQSLSTSRVNFKDQWASHPATAERETHLKQLNVQAGVNENAAWLLFDNAEKLQEQLTQKVYQNVELPQDIKALDAHAFEHRLQQDIERFSLPEAYNKFYDKRQITRFNAEELSLLPEPGVTFANIFSSENAGLQKKISAAESDLLLLKAIEEKHIDARSFDFDGEKYQREEAATVAGKLQEELNALKAQLESVDKQAYTFIYKKVAQQDLIKGQEIKNGYAEYFNMQEQADAFFKHAQEMLQGLEPVYQGNCTIEQVQEIIKQLKTREVTLRTLLNKWMGAGAFDHEPELKNQILQFVHKDYTYFTGTEFLNNELNEMHNVVNESWSAINDFIFLQFKKLLQTQLPYLQ